MRSARNRGQLFLWVIILLISGQVYAQQEKPKLLRDTLDGAFDISRWLFELNGFIPVVSVITEPALGFGGALAGVYFLPKEKTDKNEFRMPDIVGAGGGYTQNGTWFAGGGYAGFWKDDRIRYRGLLGYGDINLKYYGLGDGYLAKNPAEFNIQSLFFLQQLTFRIGETPFMMGGKYFLGKTKVTAFEESVIPEVDQFDFNLINSGLGIIMEYETFNNILSPSEGIRVHLNYSQSLELLGSDRNFGRLTFFTIGYFPVTSRWHSGLRVESMLASSNTPFYSMPFIGLRGVPVLRYQGELTMLAETEQFVNVYKRWSMVGFGGVGTTIPSLDDLNFGEPAWNVGFGFRYLLSRLLGLQMGMDIARGPEDFAFYIVFGSSWLK